MDGILLGIYTVFAKGIHPNFDWKSTTVNIYLVVDDSGSSKTSNEQR